MDKNGTIRILTDFEEKQKTRSLYEQAFDDPPAFVDYYYSEKCRNNTMIVLEENGTPLSMLHLNPYTLSVCGKEVKSYYIVAVATDKDHRRQGYMAQVLERAFAEMTKEQIPFCFLLPVNEAIYTPFGFETICDFVTREQESSALPYEDVQNLFDIYCVQDALYKKHRAEEDRLAEMDASEVLPENPVIMARVTDERTLADLLSMPQDAASKALLAHLKSLRCYFREEV